MGSLEVIGITLGSVAVLVVWLAIIRKWRTGLRLLLYFMPFAGVLTLILYPSSFATIFKDILFVIPLYIGFYLYMALKTPAEHEPRFPGHIVIFLCLLIVLVLVQSFNPKNSNWLVVAIGIKVWLFYLPMIFIGFAFSRNIVELVRLVRVMVVTAWIPCLIGIGEYIASSVLGYQWVMTRIYGSAAKAATQDFRTYDLSGLVFRIPSTFSYWLQYSGFALSMIVIAYILLRIDPTPTWRKIAKLSLILFIVAALLSGAKANFIFVPMLILFMLFLEGSLTHANKVGIIVLCMCLIIGVFAMANFDLVALFEIMRDLTIKYYNDIVIGGLSHAIEVAPWGLGTGTNTGPARHALDNYNYDLSQVIENYYAKAVIELGLIGLIVVIGLFFVIIFQGIKQHLKIHDKRIKSCSAAFLGFIIVMTINSLKGWQIDIDPINVYFWLFAGILLRLKYFESPGFYQLNQSAGTIHQSTSH